MWWWRAARLAPRMGQPIAVVRKPSTRKGIVRFEINRSLTGMGNERYRSAAEAVGPRPPDELARRLFAAGGDAIAAIHVYSNIITIELRDGTDASVTTGFEDVIASLYI